MQAIGQDYRQWALHGGSFDSYVFSGARVGLEVSQARLSVRIGEKMNANTVS